MLRREGGDLTLSHCRFRTVKVRQNFKDHIAVGSSKVELNEFGSARKLAEFKKTALRRGTWFRALSRLERGVIDLTVKYVENIKSQKLAKVVTAIIEKLQQAIETTADRLVRTIGLPLARKNSNIAVSWGNLSASEWAEDRTYARYLTLNTTNGGG